jgi:hypothetical protein
VKLTLKNRSQPFLKVGLPADATILSSEVQGVAVKPVVGADGNRVPLFRPGFRPTDVYEVSFVFLHSGTPFARKGDTQLALPKMDIAVANLNWEVFLPDRYKVSKFDGDVLAEQLFPFSSGPDAAEEPVFTANLLQLPVMVVNGMPSDSVLANGQIGGIVTDPTGAIIANASVRIRHLGTGALYSAMADQRGQWRALVPAGPVQVDIDVTGFKRYSRTLTHDARRFTQVDAALEVGAAAENITVTADAPLLKTDSGTRNPLAVIALTPGVAMPQAASANVQDLQRRVSGVLPITVSVPKAGNSYRFVRPLVIDEETTLTFRYRGK